MITIFNIILHFVFGLILYVLIMYNIANKLERFTINRRALNFYHLSEAATVRDPNSQVVAVVLFSYKKKDQDCQLLSTYLRANLKSNGGVLDKIVFGIKRSRFASLYQLQESNPSEIFVVNTNDLISSKYSIFHENDFVFKINENVVFIANNSFQIMLDEYLESDYDYLSANVISDSFMFSVHLTLKAIKPFMMTFFNNWMIYDQTNSKILEDCRKVWSPLYRCSYLAHENFFYNLKLNNLRAYNFGRWNFSKHSNSFILFKGYQLKKDLQHLDNFEQFRANVLAIGSAIVSYVDDFEKDKHIVRRYLSLANTYLYKEIDLNI